MAIESLNRYIKKEKLQDMGNIRLDKLLGVLEEVVDDKMWKRIVAIKRPHRNTYQGRAVARAHKKAEELKTRVKEIGHGQFIVKSSTTDKYYNISYKQPCVSALCREMLCEVCKVCIHKYSCECIEYKVKSMTCKHVHAVCMFESARLISTAADNEAQNGSLHIGNEEEICEFLNERKEEPEIVTEDDLTTLIKNQGINFFKSLDGVDKEHIKGLLVCTKRSCNILFIIIFLFTEVGKEFQVFLEKANKILNRTSRKRKLEHQSYYPPKQKKQ